MRTTLRIDDDLLQQLRERAHRENISFVALLNRVLRRGLETETARPPRTSRRYREPTLAMGVPRVGLDKALALAAWLEDEEVAEELARRK